MQIFDPDLNKLAHAGASVEKQLHQKPVAAGMAVSGFDQPFDLGAIQSFDRPAALARRFQPQFTARLFDHVFGLVISQVMLAPNLGRLKGGIAQGVRFLVLTANFVVPGTGFAALRIPGYAGKFAVCSFCELYNTISAPGFSCSLSTATAPTPRTCSMS